jgi:glycosyltransferase involved in cell wall biosynthesis
MIQPLVSVIMPVYNAEPFLREAVDSILVQTYTNFELLVFDDHSTDNSLEILKSYCDKRIKIVAYTENNGIVRSLNDGINKAEGKYIARMDADDISIITRFEKQVIFMEQNPDIGVCGTWYECFGQLENLAELPAKHDDIYTHMLLIGNIIPHSAVMLRRDVLIKNNFYYDPAFEVCQDFNLWVRLADVTRFHIIPESLLKYRWYGSNSSSVKREKQRINNEKIKMLAFEKLFKRALLSHEINAIQILNNAHYRHKYLSKKENDDIEKLYYLFIKFTGFTSNDVLISEITHWEHVIRQTGKSYYLKKIIFSPIIKYSKISLRDRIYTFRKKRK